MARIAEFWVYQDSDTFYSSLDVFLSNGTNARFKADIVFDDGGEIQVCVCACGYLLA